MHFRYDELSQALDESKERTYSFGRTEIVQSMIDDHFFFSYFLIRHCLDTMSLGKDAGRERKK